MLRRIPLASSKRLSDVNLTSMMDLTFILLITFIITFPMLEQGIPVNLPKGAADPTDAKQYRAITLDAQGKLFLDNNPVSLGELGQAMGMVVSNAPETIIRVRADDAIRYGQLVEVLKVLHDAKVTRMALITRSGQ